MPARFRRRRRQRRSSSPAQRLPEAKAERVYTVERIDRREIEQSPSHELDQLLKDVPGRAAVPPLGRAQRSSDQPGHHLARARRQCLEPRTAGARRSAAERSVRRLGQLASLRSGGPARNPRGARRRQRRQRARRACRDDRNDQPHRCGRFRRDRRRQPGFARGARARSALRRRRRAQPVRPRRARRRLHSGHARRLVARPTSPRLIASGAGAGAGSRRSAARRELQASLDGFHDWRTRGTDFTQNRTNGADASLRLVGRGSWQWSALGYWQWRNLMSSFASVSPGRIDGDARVAAGFGAVARARRKRGAAAADAGGFRAAARRRCAAERRASRASSSPMSRGEPTRRRVAGGETWTSGAFRRSKRRAWRDHADRRRAARSLAGQRRPSVRAGDRHRRRHCATSMIASATAGCRPRAAACRRCSAAA